MKIGLVLILLSSCKKNDVPAPATSTPSAVTDIDGNVYNTATIGTQTWTVENLKVTTYQDGTPVPLVTDNMAWSNLTTAGYCWYDNNSPKYKDPYGALYNWYAVNTGKLCPTGWHIPSDTEWMTLTNNLGGENIAGDKLKEAGTSHWASPNAGANNKSGFTALPGSFRTKEGGFDVVGFVGYWWSSTESDASRAWFRGMRYLDDGTYRYFDDKGSGYSVRCIRD